MTASDEELRAALDEGNIPILLLVLVQLTGDRTWLEEPFKPSRTVALNDNDDGGLPDEIRTQIREAAFGALREWRDGERELAAPPLGRDLIDMLSVSLGEQIPSEYAESMAEEAAFIPRGGSCWPGERPAEADSMHVVVIGAGPSGLAAAVTLKNLGIRYTVVEKNEAPGGVWRDNHYPGAGVDTPAHIYSYSFAPRRGWARFYAKQPEILDYFQGTAEELEITPHIRFNTEVVRSVWDEDGQRWHVYVREADGSEERLDATAVISCVGVLNRPSIPKFQGMSDFQGPMFHSSQWDHTVDLTNKTVAVIGTGATSMQLVPAIAGTVGKVLVFQRSPQWVAPNPNYQRESSKGILLMMEQVPFYATFYRLRQIWQFQDKLLPSLRRDPDWPHKDRSVNAANDKHRIYFTQHIENKLGDRLDLLDKVLPTYPPYGKRILMDNNWIETVKRDDVALVTESVAGFDDTHVLTTDGKSYEADIVVLATGFQSSRMLAPMDIEGRESARLREVWQDDNPFAYLGITVPHFPNFFIVGGPNTAAGHGGSALFVSEVAISYIAQMLVLMVEDKLSSVDVREDVTRTYNEKVDAEHEQLIWTHPGMTVWYKNASGRVTANMPWRGVDYWEMTQTPNLADFLVQKDS
ncbi:MAG: NAD(P)/FAD-dependent oxidoreductase [Hyphomicrobiales bacterium]|nr:MAG: NAD(P)/FAD-dependent oxidoreductase [Hyphomicrobiales bacterium]